MPAPDTLLWNMAPDNCTLDALAMIFVLVLDLRLIRRLCPAASPPCRAGSLSLSACSLSRQPQNTILFSNTDQNTKDRQEQKGKEHNMIKINTRHAAWSVLNVIR